MILLFCVGNLFSQFRVDVNYLIFHIPDDTDYIEFQYLIPGNSLIYTLNNNGKYQGSAIATIGLHSQSSSAKPIEKEIHFITEEYNNSQPSDKKDNFFLNRIQLPQGQYTLYVCLKDEHNPEGKPLCFSKEVTVNFERDKVSMSDIQNIASVTQAESPTLFSKNGLEIIPYFSDYFPAETEELTFMQEIYNTDRVIRSNKQCKIVTYISSTEEDAEIVPYKKIRYFSPTQTYVFLWSFKLGELPSGNYNLHINVYDPEDKLLCCDSMFFQRSNPAMDRVNTAFTIDTLSKDTLVQYIDYLTPIAKTDEVDFIRSASKQSYDDLVVFFRDFWLRRNPEDPWDAWFQYYTKVQRVNNSYTTLRLKGYRSDRGHYYLKYGAPSEIEYYPMEEGLYPYEIWRYYQLDDQVDVYFIFGDLDLNTKEFTMICSNKKDEIYDPRWKFRLKPKDKRPFDINEKE